MKNKKVLNMLKIGGSLGVLSSVFVGFSASFSNETENKNKENQVNEAIYWVDDNKYEGLTNKGYSVRIDSSDTRNIRYFTDVRTNGSNITKKVKFVDPNSHIKQRSLLSNSLETDMFKDIFKNPFNVKKMKVIFNDDDLKTGVWYGGDSYGGSSAMRGGILLSKDLRFYDKIIVNIWTREKEPKLLDSQVVNIGNYDNGNLKQGGSIGAYNFQNINTANRWTYWHDYQSAVTKKDEWVGFRNVDYFNSYSNANPRNKSSLAELFTVRKYNLNNRDGNDDQQYKGLYNQYFVSNNKFSSGFVLNNENGRTPFEVINSNAGALFMFNANTKDTRTSYLVEVSFSLTGNTELFNANSNDYNSRGQSFVAVSASIPKNGDTIDNELSVTKVYTANRNKSNALKLITREALNSGTSKTEIVPNVDIEVYNKDNGETIYTISKNANKYNAWKPNKNNENTYLIENAAFLTSTHWNGDYQKLGFRVKGDENKKKWSISSGDINLNVDPNLTNFSRNDNWYFSRLEWDYTDLYKFEQLLKNATFLTKGQKDELTKQFKEDLDSNTNNVKSKPKYHPFEHWKLLIKSLNTNQSDLEKEYVNLLSKIFDSSVYWTIDLPDKTKQRLTRIDDFLYSDSNNEYKKKLFDVITKNYYLAWHEGKWIDETKKIDQSSWANIRAILRGQNKNNNIIHPPTLRERINEIKSLISDLAATDDQNNKLNGVKNVKNVLNNIETHNITKASVNSYNNKQAWKFTLQNLDDYRNEFKSNFHDLIRKIGKTSEKVFEYDLDKFLKSTDEKLNLVDKQILLKNTMATQLAAFTSKLKPLLSSIYYTGINGVSDAEFIGASRKIQFDKYYGIIDILSKSLNGKYTGSEENKNFFSSLEALKKDLPPLEEVLKGLTSGVTEFWQYFPPIVDEFNRMYANAGALSKVIKGYSEELLGSLKNDESEKAKIIKGYWENSPEKQAKNSIISKQAGQNKMARYNGVKLTDQEYNIINFVHNERNNNIDIEYNFANSNASLWKIEKNIYQFMINKAKEIVAGLTYLPTNHKNTYESKLDAEMDRVNGLQLSFSNEINDEEVKQIFLEDAPITKLLTQARELDVRQKELNELAEEYAKSSENFDYTNKQQTQTRSAETTSVLFKNTDRLNATPKAKQFTEVDEGSATNGGKLKVVFNLVDNTALHDITLTSKDVTTSKFIKGFARNTDAEIARLKEVAKKIWISTYTGDKNVSPDQAVVHQIVFKDYSTRNNPLDVSTKRVKIINTTIANLSFSDFEVGDLPVSYEIESLDIPGTKITINANELRKTLKGDDLHRIFLKNFWTEQTRVDNQLSRIDADVNDKDNIKASTIDNLNKFTFTGLDKVAIDKSSFRISNKNDETGTLDITFKIASDRPKMADLNNIKSDSEKTITIRGFLTNNQAERQRLEKLASKIWVWSYSDDTKITTPLDALDVNKVTFMYAPTGTTDPKEVSAADVEIINKKIATLTRDDHIDGNLPVSYRIQSTTNPDIYVDVDADALRTTLSGDDLYRIFLKNCLTEQNRVNDVISDVTMDVDDKTDIKASTINSLTQINVTNLNDVEIDTDSVVINSNDQNGTLSVKFKVKSSKPDLENIISNDFRTISISGFLTTTAETKQTLISKIDTQYPNLNPKQKSDLINKINFVDNENNATTAFDSASTINNNMATLKGLIADAEAVKSDVKYTEATETVKKNFDTVLAQANNLLTSDSKNGEADPNLDTLINNKATPNSLNNVIANLDGQKVVNNKSINTLKFLTAAEKRSFTNQIDAINLSNENATNQMQQIKARAVEQNNAKQEIHDNLATNYEHLNPAQLSAYKQKVKTTDKDDLNDNVITPAENDNNLMNQVKEELITELKFLTENTKDTKDNDVSDPSLSLTDLNTTFRYKWANNKRAYGEALKEAQNLVSSSGTNDSNTVIQRKLNSLKEAYKLVKEKANRSLSTFETVNKGAVTNLTATQKNKVREAYFKKATESEAVLWLRSVSNLNQQLGLAKAAKWDDVKTQTVYQDAEENKQRAYDAELVKLKNKIKKLENKDYFNNLNKTQLEDKLTEFKNAINKVQTAYDALNGIKNKANQIIDKFEYLEPSQKTEYKGQISSADNDQTSVDKILKTAFEAAKIKVNKQIDSLDNLSNNEKAKLKEKVNDATYNSSFTKTPDENLKSILDSAGSEQAKKQDAINYVNTTLTNLNNAQKAALLEEIKSSDTTNIDSIKTKAATLNESMKNLKETVLSELGELTNQVISDPQDKVTSKTNNSYKLATEQKKTAYDSALSEAQSLLDENSGSNLDNNTVTTLLGKLRTAYGELDGKAELNKVNTEIDKLSNLSQASKEQLKNNIKNKTSEEIKKIVESAKKLNEKLATAKTKTGTISATKQHPNYADDKQANKTKFDSAGDSLKGAITSLESNDLTNKTADQLNQLAQELESKSSAFDKAKEQLDGIREKANNTIDAFNLVGTPDKEALKQKITNLGKQTDSTNVNSIVAEALEKAKTAAKAEVDKLQNLNEDEKKALKSEITSAPLNSSTGAPDKALSDIIAKGQTNNELKQTEINTINGLANLSDKQKEALVSEVKSQPAEQANATQSKATTLNDTMGELKTAITDQLSQLTKKTVSDVNDSQQKIADKYQSSSSTKKSNYDTKLQSAIDTLNKKASENKDIAAVNKALNELKTAFNNLDGDQELVKSKSEIDNLSNLDQKTKDELKNNIQGKSKEEIDKIIEAAKKLDKAMAAAKAKRDTINTTKQNPNYVDDKQTNKTAFDNAGNNLNSAITGLKSNDLTKKTVDELNKLTQELETKSSAFDTAKEQLDGIREKAKNTINNFDLVSPEDKSKLIAEINNLSKKQENSTKVDAVVTKALDKAKVSADNKIDALENLTKDEKTQLKNKVDTAQLNSKVNEKADKLINDIVNEAKQKNTNKSDVISSINANGNLTDKQKEALVNEVKSQPAEQASATQTKATELNKAMADLKTTITSELSQLTNKTVNDVNDTQAKTVEKYTLADYDKKSDYDSKLAEAKKIFESSYAKTNKQEIENAKTQLETAFDALNGEDAKKANDTRIDALDKLTPEQKQTLKDKVNKTPNQQAANELITKLEELNKAVKSLEDSKTDGETVKTKSIYNNEDLGVKSKYDQALTDAAQSLDDLASNNFDNVDNLDQIISDLNSKKTAIDTQKGQLDGTRKTANKLLDSFVTLNSNEIKPFKDKVDALEKNASEEQTKEILKEAFDKAKADAKVDINKTNLTGEYKQELIKQIESAQIQTNNTNTAPDKQIQDVLNSALSKDEEKKKAVEVIDGLKTLNDNQKEAFKNEILSTENSKLEDIKLKATELNNLMWELKQEAIKEIKELIGNTEATIESSNDPKVSENYKYASDDKKATYDEVLKKAVQTLNKVSSTDKTQVKTLLDDLKDKYNSLDGATNQTNAKSEIYGLEKLSEQQKNAIKDLIDKADNKDKVDEIINSAKAVNESVKELEQAKAKAEAKKSDSIYTKDSQTNKDALDKAIELAEKTLQGAKTNNYDSLNKLLESKKALEKDKETIKAKEDNLDGNREELRNKVDNLDNLTLAQKEEVKQAIDKLTKTPKEQEKTNIINQAINEAKQTAKSEVDKLQNLSDTEKQQIKDNINSAQTNTTADEKLDKNITDLLEKAKEDNKAKETVKSEIDKLNNLNNQQKESLKDKVQKSNADQKDSILSEAKELDKSMKNLKDKANEIVKELTNNKADDYASIVDKDADQYKYADKDKKEAFDKKLEEVKEVLNNKNDANKDKAFIDNLIKELQNAKNDLNGKQNLSNSKDSAKEFVDGLTNLTSEQKTQIKQQIDDAQNTGVVNTIKENASKLDELAAKIKEAETKQNSEDYTKADQEKKTAFDNAKKAIEDAIKNNIDNLSNPITNADELKQALEQKANELNGDENSLSETKDDVKSAIDVLENLTKDQKDQIKNQIDRAKDKGLVDTIKENASKLDELTAKVKEAETKQNSDNYTKADQDKKTAFDNAKKAIEDAIKNNISDLSNPITNADELKQSLDQKAKDLNGEQNLSNSKGSAKEFVDGLTNLTNEQKAQIKQQIDDAQNTDVVDTIKENASKLDELAAKIKEAETKQNSDDYTKADQDKKTAFDNAKKAIEDAIKNNIGNLSNHITNADELKQSLDQKAKDLNGDENSLSKAKEDAKSAIDALENLTSEQKAQIKQQIDDAQNKDLVDTIKENASKLDELAAKVKEAETKQNSKDYTKADQDKKTAFDEAKKAIEDAINNKINDLNTPITNVDDLKQILDQKAKDLNGKRTGIWPYVVAASAITWLIGFVMFIFGKKK
ncbi:hypothetical protein U5U50_01895 [Mycoplasma sp. 888]|uniref:hypothetical protein n=1 Tax=Mycoplasma sp. 888 TaxID=3108483 RepID=UPI002D789EC2|nr:hypothetical protein [Mycoplasma sp. 888]WRQ25547.1 hypothetical protein U5U50_01895 [Mycoplasma sp. 888]